MVATYFFVALGICLGVVGREITQLKRRVDLLKSIKLIKMGQSDLCAQVTQQAQAIRMLQNKVGLQQAQFDRAVATQPPMRTETEHLLLNDESTESGGYRSSKDMH